MEKRLNIIRAISARIILNRLFVVIIVSMICFFPFNDSLNNPYEIQAQTENGIKKIFNSLNNKNMLQYEAFKLAYQGLQKLSNEGVIHNSKIITIIDYSKPSTEKRLFVIDLELGKVLINEYVAHGKNSGNNLAKSFSNEKNTLKSSLGFYATLQTYYGKHGLSLKLQGLEKGFNDNAEDRAIVLHGAWYVSESFKTQYGRLGRSWGCPAVPISSNKRIIELIENGKCLFIYYNDEYYLKTSKILN